MPRARVRDAQGDFRGGLNLSFDDGALGPNEVRRADESVLTEYGAITKRLGSQRLSDTPLADDVQNGFAWLKDNGTQELLAVANGRLYTGTFGFPATFTIQTGNLKTSGAPAFAAFRAGVAEVAYIADGDSATSLNKWNGSTLTTNLANTPAGITSLAVYNQRLFGVTGTDQKVYWSALNDGDSLGYAPSDGGEAIIRTFGDQNVVGLAAMRSSLLIFHVSGISRFTGLTQDDIAIAAGAQGLTTDVGTVAPRSIVNTPEAVFFLSDRGFYAASESQVAPISVKLDPLLRGLDLTTAQNVIGVHNRAAREVWWFLPGKGVYRYNYALQAWTGPCSGGYLAPSTTALWEGLNAEAQPVVLIGDAGGYIKLADVPGVYNDNVAATGIGGTGYSLAVRCRRFEAQDAFQTKAWKWVYVECALRGSMTAGLSWSTQRGAGLYTFPGSVSPGTWGTGTWGTGTWGAGATAWFRVPIDGIGPYIDISLTDDGESASSWSRIEIDGFDYGRRY